MIQKGLFPQIINKKCNKCGERKLLNEFYKSETNKDGLGSYCKRCVKRETEIWSKNNYEKVKEYKRMWAKNNIEKVKESSRKWARKQYKNNPEKIKNNSKKWRENNLESARMATKNWRKNNSDKVKEYDKMWRKNNPEKVKEISKTYYKNNSEKCKKRNKKYRKENPEKVKKSKERWRKENPEKMKEIQKRANKKNRSTLRGKLDKNMGKMIWKCLKGNKLGRKWKDLVEWDKNDLQSHLEKHFVGKNAWMNRNNYGGKPGLWTVDHIIPQKFFHYKIAKDPEFKACWSLENLQPMEYVENIKKGRRLDFDDKQKETLEILNKKFNLNLFMS